MRAGRGQAGTRGAHRSWDLAQQQLVLSALVEALCHVHSKGWVHGDVKPGNVLIRFLGPDGQKVLGEVKLGDFGYARRADQLAQLGGWRAGWRRGRRMTAAQQQMQQQPFSRRVQQRERNQTQP